MFITLCIGALLLGAIVGSFLNALLFRFNTGRSIIWARSTSLRASRSQCMHCGHMLESVDLVPIFSFLFLRGRCRFCKARISLQYPVVEAAGALLSLAAFVAHPAPLAYVFWLLVWMVLLFIVVYDIRHTIIPWSASALLGALALASLFVSFDGSLTSFILPPLLALFAGPILAMPLFLLSLISGGRWMGWGDSPLALSLGWLLGLTGGLTAFMLAVWSGAAVGIALMLLKRGYKLKSELPFAPFLVLGALVVHFLHVDFFQALPLLLTSW